MVNMTNIQAQYVEAVMAGRFASAEYLKAQLPEVDLDMVCPPGDERDSFSCFGSITLTTFDIGVKTV